MRDEKLSGYELDRFKLDDRMIVSGVSDAGEAKAGIDFSSHQVKEPSTRFLSSLK